MVPPDPSPFSLFVSCKAGTLAQRWGTTSFIGAERDPGNPTEVHYYPERVVAIPAAEHARHRKAFDRQVAEGDVVVRRAADWVKQETDRAETESAHLAKKAAAVIAPLQE